ncbi:MAG: hypothetical protein LBK67_01335, partial [Coriobacteriales bacterium]|nr:hypothetical protein [Coriobacteriales bacterium]
MRKKQLLSDDSLQVPLWRYFGIAFAISFAPMLGSSGTGWISAFEQSREFSSLAFLVYYAIAALALLCALHLKGDRIPVKPLYIGISLAATIGICLLCLTGLKIIDARFYLLGTIAVSLSMIPLVLAWGRIFKTLNANTMRICVSGSFLVAWILHLALNEISRLMPLFATALLLLLPWVSLWLLYSVQGARQDTGHPSPDKAKHLHMPAHMLGGILVYGVVFGFIVNLTTHSSTITANAGIVQSLLIGCVAASLFLAAIFSNNLNSRLMYRPVLPLVVVGFLLVPILGFGSLDFANAIVIAGVSYFRIFWVIV